MNTNKPCTPLGIMDLLHNFFNGSLAGLNMLVIGKGNLVGKPLSKMLLDEGVTVTVCHSKTCDVDDYIYNREYDAIIFATGKPFLIDVARVSNGTLFIDCGVKKDEQGKVQGDIYLLDDENTLIHATPVPKGVGLLTTAMVVKNVHDIFERCK